MMTCPLRLQNQGGSLQVFCLPFPNDWEPFPSPTILSLAMPKLAQCLLFIGFILHGSTTEAQTIAFDPETQYEVGHVPEAVALGDLNGDGKIDVVVANSAADGETGGNSISVLLGNSTGIFTRAGNFPVNGTRPEGVTIALIDSDSNLDVVTNNFTSNDVSVLLGKGDGTFENPRLLSVPGGPRFVVAGDFNGDGANDLATSDYDDDKVTSLRGSADGNFTISTTIPVGNSPEMLAVANLTPDGILDLLTCNRFGDTITPLSGNGDGTFTPGTPHEVGKEPRFLIASDLNGDGLDDVVVANNSSHTITIEKNEGSLTFSGANTLRFTNPSILLLEPVYLAEADMNDDGDRDLLATYAESGAFTIFPQSHGAFDYGTPSTIQSGTTPVGIAAADFNSDGTTDVVVANANDETANVYLSYTANPGVIVDNGTAGTRAIGPWAPSDTPFSFGKSSLFSKDGTRYVWTASVPEAGQYEVLLWWTVTEGRATSVPVEVRHADGSTSFFVDQTKSIGVWHPLGVYPLTSSCTVTITAPQGNKSVSADAVRFRKLPSAPAVLRGSTSVASLERPEGYRIDKNRALAFHGRIAVDSSEGEDIVAALFSPIGPGSESTRIAQLKLFADSNGNATYDSGDRQLGDVRSFDSDIRTVVFDGFRESVADDSAVDIFVVAEFTPAAVALRERAESAPVLALAVAVTATWLLRRRRNVLVRFAPAAILLVTALLLPFSGCKSGGGGGGGGSQDLQLQLTSIVAEGQSTSTPAVNTGLPLDGWKF